MVNVTNDGAAKELWFTPDLSDYTPQNVAAKSDGKKIYLSWDHPIVNNVMHPDIKGYRIYHSVDDASYVAVSTMSRNFPRTMTWFQDFDVGTHYFKISTVFKHEYESPLSSSVSIVHGEGYGE